jgi:phage recombination protein Bet
MGNDLITQLATESGMDRSNYWNTIKATVMPQQATTEQVIAFLSVARAHNLNPITKEIYAFPSKGGVMPIVGVDGWLKMANAHPMFDGMETEEVREGGDILAVRCVVHRKDRSHPVTATEYMSECKRNTEPWRQWPVRMLTNKAMIQAIRRAFSFAGIYDPDEGERIREAEVVEIRSDADAVQTATADKTAQLRERIESAGGNASQPDQPPAGEGDPGTGQEMPPAPDTVDELIDGMEGE